MLKIYFFTESAPRLIQSISHNVGGAVAMSGHIMYILLSLIAPIYKKVLGEMIDYKSDEREVVSEYKIWTWKKIVFGSWQTIRLCIIAELAGGESVVVAVAVSDM